MDEKNKRMLKILSWVNAVISAALGFGTFLIEGMGADAFYHSMIVFVAVNVALSFAVIAESVFETAHQ